MNRRDFLRSASATALISALHPEAMFAQAAPLVGSAGRPLLSELRLVTGVPLAEMKRYYRDVLGLSVVSESPSELTVATGSTRLTFRPAGPEQPTETEQPAKKKQSEPLYHFAFNIPRNKLLSARRWLLERGPLVQWPEERSDPAYPNDVRHFTNWNAHSLFFWDPAGNVLEFIARHTLANDSADPDRFSVADILYASEIAFVVDEQSVEAHRLHDALGVPAYPKGTDSWWSMGDEHGLLLCIPRGRPFGDDAKQVHFGVYPTEATLAADGVNYRFEGFPYRIVGRSTG